jgi:peptidoglycan/xylan/chitin deacetylase (PgdA/CDA1 family)
MKQYLINSLKYSFGLLAMVLLLTFSSIGQIKEKIGMTSITLWPDNKQGAISLTYDDGTINQFTVARPIMNSFGFPGTFYINSGKVEGSVKGKFIGRSGHDIIEETALQLTNENNLFERASFLPYTGLEGAKDLQDRAGLYYEYGRIKEACILIDESYKKVRLIPLSQQVTGINDVRNKLDSTTWMDFKRYTAEGHEIACHTVSHTRLAILDEPNLIFELEQCKTDIEKHLGTKYIFSAECPFGTENERVMEYAHKIFPALRNRMPEPWLEELNRASKIQPLSSNKEYVQWHRGTMTNTPMSLMKSWVDTCLVHNNIWLVLVFHGVDGVGWEPKKSNELKEYFFYMHERKDRLWIATFADVTKYLRERKACELLETVSKNQIQITLTSSLDPSVYDIPLTLKTYVPDNWGSTVQCMVGKSNDNKTIPVLRDETGNYVLYSALSTKNRTIVTLTMGN